jgi:uncharacterized protein YbaP (TraB family)
MKKILAVAIMLFGLGASAQNANALLWKISGSGLKAPSYLYGTIHITCDATLPKNTLDALDKTAQLYLELDMDDPAMQAALMGGMMMNDGKTMSSMTSPEDFKILDAFMQEKIGVSAIMVNTMKPFMISSMFLPSVIDCPMQSVETELMKITKDQHEETYGLETVAEQLAVFDAIPYQIQMDELVKSVKDKFVGDKKELDEMYALYKSMDIDAMQDMTATSENKITADYQDQLLNDRNKKWTPKIEAIAKEKPTFFAVGAGHLGGKKGLIALLKAKGYKVEAVL